MRKMAMVLTAAIFTLSSVSAFAETKQTQPQKDECLLASKNCLTQVDDIRTRIHKLDKEIKKGTRVYSADELKKLQQKLKETSDTLKTIENPDS